MSIRVHPALRRALPRIAPGVAGNQVNVDGETWFPFIAAVEPGNGDVGRWLDSLVGEKVIIPNVVSDELKGMLLRRGWTKVWRADVPPVIGGGVPTDGWVPPDAPA